MSLARIRTLTGRLRVRTALTMTAIIVGLLVVNAVILIVQAYRGQRSDLETRARVYAHLATGPLCVAYETYRESGQLKLIESVRELMQESSDLEAIRIVDVSGRVGFDSTLEPGVGSIGAEGEPEPVVEGGEEYEAIGRLEATIIPRGGGTGFEIVVPHVEEWGRHRLSVIYEFSYAALRSRLLERVYSTAALTGLAILVSLGLGVSMAGRITGPLERLTERARGMAQGRFGERLDIRTGDEVQELADSFDQMSNELAASLSLLEQMNRELIAANQELEGRNAELERFTYTVSHDLKTPLITIRGFLGFVERHARAGRSEDLRGDLARIEEATERMHKLLDGLLSLSRSGRTIGELVPVPLGELVAEATALVRAETSSAIEVAPRLPTVRGDRDRLLEVVQNLLDNALKATDGVEERRIEVGVRTGDEVTLFVRDNGVGIPPQYHEKVFGLFEKLDADAEGTGIGLALARRVVELHGGRIWIESEGLGAGTTVCLTLPTVAAAATAGTAGD
jgi:signal transduction histidine kinase